MQTANKNEQASAIVLAMVSNERKEQGRVGTRKVYRMIKSEMNVKGIKMGKDKLFTVLRENKMLIKKKKNFHKTTNSLHRYRKYPNLLKGLKVSQPEQVWVSDITYIKTEQGYEYLSRITDLYSKKLMGYYLSDNLKTEGPIQALKMALSNRKYQHRKLIHHSDRGFQYCSDEYISMLNNNGILPSMTQSYGPYENAVAERVNGILKDEFGIGEGFINHKQATKEIKRSIETYNNKRLHISCNWMTPVQAHEVGTYELKSWRKRWRRKLSLSTNINKRKKKQKRKYYNNKCYF